MKNITRYLEESLLKHIALEFTYDNIINERFGEYDGCKELQEYIYNKIKENNYTDFDIIYNDVRNINNIVFDKLFIKCINNKSTYAIYYIPPLNIEDRKNDNIKYDYNLDYSIINKSTNRFNNCIIVISIDKYTNFEKIKHIIEHELTHMYNDYKLQQKGLKSFFELFNNLSYKRIKEYNQHKHPLRASQLEHALYLMDGYEKNSFVSQLCSEIREIKKSYGKNNNEIDANKMYNIIQNLDIYQAYMNIANFINDYDNDALTKNEKIEIVKEWNNIYHEDLQLNQIFKKLKSKFIRTKQKIESIIPKKIAEEYGLYNGVMMDEGINLINQAIII